MPDPTVNPYNFVPLDREVKRSPVPRWHRLDENGASGRLVSELEALTPIFTADHQKARPAAEWDSRRVFPFLRNSAGQPILQGSTIRGMVRAVFEAAFPSCLPLAAAAGLSKKAGQDTAYRLAIPPAALHEECRNADKLCPACRLFGTILGEEVHVQGRISFGDAVLVGGELVEETIYLKELSSPKPHHYAIYSATGGEGGPIAGRKLYYHHREPQPAAATDPASEKWGKRSNALREVAPRGARFRFEVRFENLTEEELRQLTGCLCLAEGYAHKIGMGKPLGLGSCRIEVIAEESAVYRGGERYRSWGAAGERPSAVVWKPEPPALERLLRLDVHGQEEVGYLPYPRYRNRNVGIDAQGRYREVRPGARQAAAAAPAPSNAVGDFDLGAQLEALRGPAAAESKRALAQGDKIQVEVVRVEGKTYHLRPLDGGPEILHQGRGVAWQVGQTVKVKVVEVKKDGRITKVAPA
jgi:CRISPR/Cas system CSM-associated protein Csm3 (group 7 of RAMP superfamily)